MDKSEGLIWLASFPKSGNTWLRAFIDAYHNDREPDINSMFTTVSDQGVRWYQACSMEDVRAMEPGDRVILHPAAMWQLMSSLHWNPKLVKTHNANVCVSGVPLIPEVLTRRVVYLVRDPRDVVLSYAKHFGVTIDHAIDSITSDSLVLMNQHEPEKVPHWTTSWARHVQSYAEAEEVEVTVVRYEQLKEDPHRYFKWILEWIGVDVHEGRLARAVENCSLARLRAQEERVGFKEASDKADRFFGQGGTGGWRDVLSEQQVARIEAHAGPVMVAMGYTLQGAPVRAVATG